MSTTCPTLQFRERSAEALAADHGLWELYEAIFRPWLREPPAVIIESVRAGVGQVLAIVDGDATVGFSFVHLLEEPPAAFLVYLAVEPRLRGQRLGSELLDRALASAFASFRARGVEPWGAIWEMDDPDRATTEVQRERRLKRLAFFQRHGAKLLPQTYLQPPLDGGDAVPMRLCYRAEDGRHAGDARVAELVRAIYEEKYCRQNGLDGAQLESLLGRMAAEAPPP